MTLTSLLFCCCCLATQINQRATRSCIRQLITHSGLQGSRQYISAFLSQAMIYKSYSYRNCTIFFIPSFLDTLINHFCAVPNNLLKYHSLIIVCDSFIVCVIFIQQKIVYQLGINQFQQYFLLFAFTMSSWQLSILKFLVEQYQTGCLQLQHENEIKGSICKGY